MLENEVVEEIRELMKAMQLPFFAWGNGEDKKYYTRLSVEDLPLEEKYVVLEDMKLTYEKLNKTPWYSDNVSE